MPLSSTNNKACSYKLEVLHLTVRSAKANIIVVSSDSFAKEIQLKDGNEWQKITVTAQSLKNALGDALSDWYLAKELRFSANGSFRERAEGEVQNMELGAEWIGEKPEFINLQWIEKN